MSEMFDVDCPRTPDEDGGCNVGRHTVPFSAISESKISM